MAGLGLFLFTSALGRVWCGYACPHTVWTDLFILVERWIEGDRNARLRLHRQEKLDARKIRLRLTKWVIWFGIGLATGGAWVFYFADAPTLLRDLVTLSAHPAAYTTMLILTLTTFFFGGFAREQICNYACPWPRIQAAMLDEDSLVVGYREWRGEPRGKGNVRRRNAEQVMAAEAAVAAAGPASVAYAGTPYPNAEKALGGTVKATAQTEEYGDCIDCMACVNVCPAGIDIRDGQQMECITCALCIDACDDVMDKIGKPRGLIDYMALSDEVNERAGMPPKSIWTHIFRPRTMMYTGLWAAVGLGLVFALFIRPQIEMSVAPVRNPTFVTLSDGSVRNTYDVRLLNKHGDDRPFRITAQGDPALLIQLEGSPYETVMIPANSTTLQRVYLVAPSEADPTLAHRTEVRFWVEDVSTGDRAFEDSIFNGRGD